MAENNRVYELAKHYGLSSKALLAVLEELGVMAKSHMSVLAPEDVELVEQHFAKLEAKGERVVEKTRRVEVEKAKPKAKRLSAKEKLAAKRAEQAERAKRKAEEEARAAEEGPAPEAEETPEAKPAKPARKIVKVPEPEPETVEAEAAPSEETPAVEETPVAEAEGVGEESAAPQKAEVPAPKAKPAPARRRSADLSAVAKAAAATRARIHDDMKTRKAEPETPRPPKRKPAPEEGPRRGARSDRDATSQPRPIDPSAIRNSVRQTLARLEVPRQSSPGPATSGARPRKRAGRQAREDRKEKAARQRAREEALQPREDELRITEFITVQELADKLGVKSSELIMKLMGMNTMATINQRLERDTIELLVSEYEVDIHWLDTAAGEDIELPEDEDEAEAVGRPPVVTVMGHVDHGKTTLLDTLRSTEVTATEAGGITQHIGAYQVETERGAITFLDTPGHEAFTAMRARGAKVTDIVVVVVAADDKVMPQTVEAIDHSKASNTPIIIAVNKIDLPGADPAGVKQQLMQHNVLVEEFGGEVQCVEISAKKGTNIDALLEAIQLQAELLELKAPKEGLARGAVIEARKDPGRGVVFTVLVNKGTLKVGDPFVAGTAEGRVRAMLDEREEPVEEATPAQPVLLLGAHDVPVAGDQFNVVRSEREAKEIASRRQRLQREQSLHAPKKKTSLEDLFDQIQERDEQVVLPLVIKGDVDGSVEALCDSLMGLSNEKVQVQVIRRGVGAISENDIILAAASDAIIIGFHLRPGPSLRNLAKEQRVDLRLYDIIYEAVEDVKKAMTGLLAPVEEKVPVGSAEVRELFRVPKVGVIAGSMVTNGEIRRNCRVRVVREQVQIYEGTISSLKRFKEDVRSVPSGYECGIGLEKFDDLKLGDILEAYEIQQVAQEL